MSLSETTANVYWAFWSQKAALVVSEGTATTILTGHAAKTPIDNLSTGHLATFKTAVCSILSTSLAEKTYAQIIDGLLTADTWLEYANFRHELVEHHEELCVGVLEETNTFLAAFNPSILQFYASLVQAYQNTSIGTREFTLRLLEMVAVACREIAVSLFRSGADGRFHKGSENWRPQPNMIIPFGGTEPIPDPVSPVPNLRASVFFHDSYLDYKQYPNGVADMVGYWAESRLFGGVVLFDRGKEEDGCEHVFIHPVGTRRLTFQPSEHQIQQFADFVVSSPQNVVSPLSLQPERLARRVDPWDALALATLHIFRNQHERKLPAYRTYNCVPTTEDYPEIEDVMKIIRERCLEQC